MKASIVDLQHKTKDILKALARNESVTLMYRGKVKGVIKPAGEAPAAKISDHPFFGMLEGVDQTVLEELRIV